LQYVGKKNVIANKIILGSIFVRPNKFTWPKFRSKFHVGQMSLWIKKNIGQKKMLANKSCLAKIFFDQKKICPQKKICHKNLFGQHFFWAQQISLANKICFANVATGSQFYHSLVPCPSSENMLGNRLAL
jgi:hypothetical protein